MVQNSNMKKGLSILCIVFLLLTLFPMATFAADEETIDLSKYKNTSYYYNGTIITVDEEQGEDADGNPIYAQAVIVGER